MYQLFKGRKLFGLFPVILFGGCIPILIYVWIHGILANGINFTAIIGLFAIGFFILIFIMFTSSLSLNPYHRINELRKTNVSLVQEIEADFDHSYKLCKNVWKGNKFYYFVGGALFVVPIGKIERIQLSQGYVRRIGITYNLKVFYQNDNESVLVSTNVVNNSHEVADQLANECQIVVENLLEKG